MGEQRNEREMQNSIDDRELSLEEQNLDEPMVGMEDEAELSDDSGLDVDESQSVGNGQGSTREVQSKGQEAPFPALFEGIQMRMRKGKAGRCVVGLEVELDLDEAKLRGEERSPGDDDELSELEGQAPDGLSAEEDSSEMGAQDDGIEDELEAKPGGKGDDIEDELEKPGSHEVKVADVQPGKKNPSVLIVQKALAKALGQDSSSGSGTFDDRTTKAYAAWQRKCGVSRAAANGKPGLRSLKMLGDKYGFTVSGGTKPPSGPREPSPERG
ncbi:hypothetical protein [Archangium lansingense]|uniref:Peptidoglycan binding-like domain-containing protein n=1 Tax=Archangium lansingense TaxID=2995310 RepID=A0ABT4AH44_9BACT|nr:hypothetical protein [Archangium lansinium]MCY1080990.1 hypothetical protein [Archangium lansinium]